MVELAHGAMLVETDGSGAINLGAHRARLAKDLATAQKELAGTPRQSRTALSITVA